uniref:PiggyBac transposable element-derived protein domain-containing protein n=1 Tax=Oreochromis niloticus TaxID=8128 RepID=A0A669F538_ORENI
MNCVLMLGCSSWPVFTGQDTNRFSASGVINPDGIFSEPPCPTSVSMKSAGRFVLTISFPDAVRTSWLPSARWGICGRIVWSCSSTQADICVDEQLVPFRGRCDFKQYIPTKPAKYGLKIWAVCDVETSYAWRLQVYTGKAGDRAEVNQGMRVALELTQGLQGNVVTCDNFFTSFALAEELLRRKLALVGTIRKNKPELPPRLLQTRGRAVFSSAFAFTLTHTLVSYVPRRGKNVLLMSTKHRTPDVSEEGKRKPVIIQDYNRCKGGVDNLDKVGVITHQLRTDLFILAHIFLCKIYIGLKFSGFCVCVGFFRLLAPIPIGGKQIAGQWHSSTTCWTCHCTTPTCCGQLSTHPGNSRKITNGGCMLKKWVKL